MISLLAKILARPSIANWIIERSKRTPYRHIIDPNGSVYMERYWVFNAYGEHAEDNNARFQWLPSIRVHRIMRPDNDRALHDHPWNARTFILKGDYKEIRRETFDIYPYPEITVAVPYVRKAGDTAALKFGEYHTITEVSEGGVYTLFCTWKYRGTWGFLVDGVKVPWREYLARKENESSAP